MGSKMTKAREGSLCQSEWLALWQAVEVRWSVRDLEESRGASDLHVAVAIASVAIMSASVSPSDVLISCFAHDNV